MSSSEVPNPAASAALALLPAPNSLEAFLTAARLAKPHGSAVGQQSGGSGNNPVFFGPNDLSEYVCRAMESALFRANAAALSNALDTLDMGAHSMGYAGVLAALLRQGSSLPDWDSVLGRVVVFVDEADAQQVRMAPQGMAELCHNFADELIRRGCPLVGIAPLKRAMLKIHDDAFGKTAKEGGGGDGDAASGESSNFGTLTSVHSDLCKLALAAKCFTPVLPMLTSLDFRDLSREAVTADSKYILLYYYYGGMILTAIKKYRLALYFFEVCITVPAVSVSHVMLEAYKKFLLVSLIEGGHRPREAQVTTLPKYTSGVVSKYFKGLSGPYNELVSAYFFRRPAELRATAERHAATFAADGNAGLAGRAVASRARADIRKLTRTFLTLSTAELAGRVELEEEEGASAENVVAAMIEEGTVHARISQKDGMVRFDGGLSERSFGSESLLSDLDARMRGCIALNGELERLDDDIAVNPAFIKRYHATTGGASGTSSSSAAAAASTIDVDDALLPSDSASGRASLFPAAVAPAPSSSSSSAQHAMMNGGGGASSTTGNGVPPPMF